MDSRHNEENLEDPINTMMTLSAFLSDNLINVTDRNLNQPEFVSTLEVLHFALKKFSEHREDAVNAEDSRCAMLLDSAWILFRAFYIKHLQYVKNVDVLNAAHQLYDLLEDYVIEAHIDINAINKILFRKNKIDKHLKLSDEEAEKHIEDITSSLAALQKPSLTQTDKAVLKTARVLLNYYLEHYVFDILNGKLERIAHMQNALHLLKPFQERWQQLGVSQESIDRLIEVFAKYEKEASNDFHFIQQTSQYRTDINADYQDESEASAELDALDDEPFFNSFSEDENEEIITFNPDNAIWHEVPFFREQTPEPAHDTDPETEDELWLEVSNDEVDSPLPMHATPRPVRAAYVTNQSFLFAHPFEGSAPIDIPFVSEDDYFNLTL